MSKVILYMAISVDGFITDQNDETPWSDDEWAAFQEFVKSRDVCLVGRRTYEIMRDDDGFVAGPEYLVVTNDLSADTGEYKKITIKSADDMPQAQKIGVIGGGGLNGSLAELGVINEIILDIEPVTLGRGKQLFGSYDIKLKLSLLSSKQIGQSTIQNHYKVENV